MRLRAVLLAIPLALVGLAVPAYADDPVLNVFWPGDTEVQVPVTPYTFTVEDTFEEPDRGTLYAVWQGDSVEIPHAGDHTMDFQKGGSGSISVFRCSTPSTDPTTDPNCADTFVASPGITVFQELPGTFNVGNGAAYGPGDKANAVLAGSSPNATVQATWQLRRADNPLPVASGSETLTLNGSGNGGFQVTLPANASTGDYIIATELTAEIAPFGFHRARSEQPLTVDATPPVVSASLSSKTIYPQRDGYRDRIDARFRSDDPGARGSARIVNSRGTVVRTYNPSSFNGTRISIDGRSASGRLLSAGSYRLQMTAVDKLGNKRVTTSSFFSLSHKRLVKKTFKRTYSAAALLAGPKAAFVGKCSTLRKPSLRRWAGSFGFYSQTKCKRAGESSVVSTISGLYVPRAFQNKYGTLQVSMYGGGAAGSGAHKGRNAYIVMHYRNNAGKFVGRSQFNGALGNHASKTVGASSLIWDKANRPFVLWGTGLTAGSRYDVKSYTLKLTYTALQ